MNARLKGMTWSHPRGYDPLVACARVWEDKTGVEITWEQRSLQDFESFPVEDLARNYDLIVIDHPHVGQVTNAKCLLPLDIEGREAERDALERGSVGPSYRSYLWQSRQWAFPIDAATQVQAWRPDLIAAPARTFDEVLKLAAEGRVAVPLRPPHVLMVFFSLAANLGSPCATEPGSFVGADVGTRVWGLMTQLAAGLDAADFEGDPIAVFERMAEPQSEIACVPFVYGYVPYSLDGFRPKRIAFADIPAVDGAGPRGAALGGTGIAVSARSAFPQEAIDFAYFVASGEVQRGLFAQAGGQPGHSDAWDDDGVNTATHGFYRETRQTLEGSYLRPRHDGYMAFQQSASERLVKSLRSGDGAERVLADLDRLFTESFA